MWKLCINSLFVESWVCASPCPFNFMIIFVTKQSFNGHVISFQIYLYFSILPRFFYPICKQTSFHMRSWFLFLVACYDILLLTKLKRIRCNLSKKQRNYFSQNYSWRWILTWRWNVDKNIDIQYLLLYFYIIIFYR